MYSSIKTISDQRITEIREYLDSFAPLIPSAPTAIPRYFNTSKGLVFVQLYGVIEYTINKTITITIELINNENVKIQDLNIFILGMALNPQFDSLIQVRSQKWDKRFELLKIYFDNHDTNINTNLIPTNGENYNYNQLQSIWKNFNITEPIFNNITFRGRLSEIVGNRINIAHGNISAAEVGSRVTSTDLYDRIRDVSEFCSYFISVFEDYIINKKFRNERE